MIRALLLATLRLYQVVLSPFARGSCRFTPSCSEYAREAIERHGIRHGFALSVRRLSRCHPFGAHGVDPVP